MARTSKSGMTGHCKSSRILAKMPPPWTVDNIQDLESPANCELRQKVCGCGAAPKMQHGDTETTELAENDPLAEGERMRGGSMEVLDMHDVPSITTSSSMFCLDRRPVQPPANTSVLCLVSVVVSATLGCIFSLGTTLP